MGERFTSQVILCWPSDRQAIENLNSNVEPDERFSPTIEHSLSTCDGCRQGVWIAEQQRQLAESPFVNARKLCITCAGHVQRTLALDPREVDLGPGVRAARRRIR